MNLPAARTPATMTLRRCLLVGSVPVLASAIVALMLAWLHTPTVTSTEAARGAASPWLLAPLFVAAASCALAAITFWPLFAARRPGADWGLMLQRGRLHGCGAATAGALLAQLLFCLPVTTWLAQGLGSPARARILHRLIAPEKPVLAASAERLSLRSPTGETCSELHLRPLAALPTDTFQNSRVQVFADGERLVDDEPEWSQTGQPVRLHFAPRRIAQIDLLLVSGTVPLFFPSGSVELVEAHDRSGLAYGCLAALVSLVPTFTALAIGCLCGVTAALPTVATVVLGILFVMTLGGLGPLDAVILQTLRGEWPPATVVFQQCIPSLLLGCAAMIGAMVLRRRHRR